MILVVCCDTARAGPTGLPTSNSVSFIAPVISRQSPAAKASTLPELFGHLGQQTTVAGFAGRLVSRFVVSQLRSLDIMPAFAEINQESRLVQNVVDLSDKTETRIDETGPVVSLRELAPSADLCARRCV